MTAKKAATSAKHKPAAKKHAASAKHTETAKQKAARSAAAKRSAVTRKKDKVTAKAKAAVHAKAVKAVSFAVGDWLPVCGFEAVAQSLRLAGQRVSGDDVAGLWELCGSPEATTIEDALAAAVRFGLAGARPAAYELPGSRRHGCIDKQGDAEDFVLAQLAPDVQAVFSRAGVHGFEVALDEGVQQVFGHGLILRIDQPGTHAVLATRDGWWSWGELYSPWPARVEEAWAVSWS